MGQRDLYRYHLNLFSSSRPEKSAPFNRVGLFFYVIPKSFVWDEGKVVVGPEAEPDGGEGAEELVAREQEHARTEEVVTHVPKYKKIGWLHVLLKPWIEVLSSYSYVIRILAFLLIFK